MLLTGSDVIISSLGLLKLEVKYFKTVLLWLEKKLYLKLDSQQLSFLNLACTDKMLILNANQDLH